MWAVTPCTNPALYYTSSYLDTAVGHVGFANRAAGDDARGAHATANLFSPAAASFDSFKSFEERGRYFNKLIKEIGNVK